MIIFLRSTSIVLLLFTAALVSCEKNTDPEGKEQEEFKSNDAAHIVAQFAEWDENGNLLFRTKGYTLNEADDTEVTLCADTIIRRYYGPSMFYTKEFADPYQVDEVHFVTDPQIDVPFDNVGKEKWIIDPQLPDFVVTAVLSVRGMDHTDNDGQIMVNTLRFVPEVKYINLSQLSGIYNDIASREMKNITGKSIDVYWTFKDEQIKKIRDYKDALNK